MTDTIDVLLHQHAERTPDRTMVVDPDVRCSYAELEVSSRELAAALLDAGINKGTRVALLLPNSVSWIRFAMAITRIGAVLVPLSTLMRAHELTAQLQIAAVQHIIASTDFRGRNYAAEVGSIDRTLLPALQHIWSPEQIAMRRPATAVTGLVDALAATVRPADPLAIVFTSGSSGAPKGTLHSHGGALGAVRSGLRARCVSADTRLYLPMPFFWVGGLAGGVLTALVAGATLVTEAIPTPETTLPLLERERVTLFRGWPDQAEALARSAAALGADLSQLRPGSLEALLPTRLRGQPGARAKLFGMTESFGPYCGYPADTDMPRTARGSCGQPLPGIQVRIVAMDTGEPVPAGTVGEIQIRGPHILRGICGRQRHEVFTPDGYYPTGDLGHLDDEGFLFYHGRSDDMFKVSGATVYPSEVETVLRSLPGVRAAHVTNVPGPQGDRVGALVVQETVGNSADLAAATRRLLSPFKVPTVWLLVDDENVVPRGPTGKVDAARLRQLLAQ